MNRPLIALIPVVALISLAASLFAQSPAQMGAAPINHIGVVVRDVGKAAKAYADIFQLSAVPAIKTVRVQLPKGTAMVRRAVVPLPNTLIEVDQPDGNSGPAADFLKKYGQGIYRVGFSTSGSIEPIVAGLEQRGGRIVAGSRDGKYADIDLASLLGTTIELQQEELRAVPTSTPTSSVSGQVVLGSTPMSSISWTVKDIDETAKAFSEVLGAPMPTIRLIRPLDIPPGTNYNPDAWARLTGWAQANTRIAMVQPVGGPTNWTEFLALRGNNLAPHHIAFPVGDKLGDTVVLFQSKGAKWSNGKPNGTYAYLDFTDKLGIILELNGKWGLPPAE